MRIQLKLDNNTWLLVAMALAIAPHTSRLPLWISLLCLAVGAMRLIEVRLPARWLLISLAAATTVGIYASFHTLLGRDAGVALLVAMLTLKLLESRTLRDNIIAIFISYFLVLTHFLYSQSIPTGLYLLLVVLVITTTLIGLNHPGKQLDPRKQLRLAAVLLGQAVPVMLVLFLFFPRVPGPLWGLPGDAYEGMTGLSDSMAPGSISKLSQSDAVAFRVAFDGPPPNPAQRYWRGPVLDLFDGRKWSATTVPDAKQADITVTGKPVSYRLTLEPHNKRWLLALDLPGKLPPASHLGARYELLADQPVRQRLRYQAVSYPNYQAGLTLDVREIKRSLRLPPYGNPKSREMAENWKRTTNDNAEIVQLALKHFRSEAFFYSLIPPLLGANSVDEFLFDSRRGFCEHYAGSFIFLMRAAGVPARVVTGYQGGESNPFGNYLMVRQSDAHAWAEVWLKNRGWVRIDPTAAVAPQRIESGLAAALPAIERQPLLGRIDSPWLAQLRMSWDTLNNDWNQWVLGYGQERQYDLLSFLGFELASWKELAIGLAAGIGVLLLTFYGFMLWQKTPTSDPVAAIYQRFCNKLAGIGINRQPNEGPADFAHRAATLRPDLALDTASISALYVALRFARNPKASNLQQFAQQVNAFRPKTSKS